MTMLDFILAAALIQGPSSSASPYVVPIADNVSVTSILTVGDFVNAKPDHSAYRLAGSPDGLGAFDNGDGTFTLLMNHELGEGSGIVRAHGERGAFVSKWTIRKRDLAVLHGEDLIRKVATWDRTARTYNTPVQGVVLRRFCSADLPARGAFFDEATGTGYDGRIYMNGEEVGAEGRAFAHLLDGTSYELPRVGRSAWENVVANPASGDKTIVVALDDTFPGVLHVYVGQKQNGGSPIDRAGLTNGKTYGVKVLGFPFEAQDSGIPSGAAFALYDLGDVEVMTRAQVESARNAGGVTRWQRPEDGSWDPRHPRDFYFATTAAFTLKSRLWRLRFHDLAHPENGGIVEMLLDGTEGHKMLDNLTVRTTGDVILQEDPGQVTRLARIWRYVPARDELTPLAEHDPLRFGPLTIGEESSGIIDASSILGPGWLLFVVQAPYPLDAELVAGGQLLAMRYPATARRRSVR
jgi:hypothetical protein